MNTFRRIAVFAVIALAISSVAQAAAFTPGNVVVYRVGTGGATTLINTGNPVFLDEYTPAGVLVQSIAMPTTVSGANKAFFASGTANTEGLMTLSTDGRYLVATGYAITNGANLTTSTAATVNRVVARVDSSGNIDTTTALSNFTSGSSPRGAASTNGTDIWLSGGANTPAYTTLGATTVTQISTTVTNLRGVHIFNGQLYISTASGTAVRIGAVGTGLPTTSGQTITNITGYPSSTGGPYAFFFADLDAVAGVDTLYVADDTAQALTKYSLVAGSWTANGTIGISTDGYRGVTGVVSGSTVTLYLTRKGGSGAAGGGELAKLTDSSGYNGAFSGTPTLLATAATNTAFRGVALVPTPATPAPTVSSIVRANPNPTNAASVDYTVTFSQSVTGVDTADFSLTTSGVAGASVSNVSGSGTTYTVTVNTGTGSGTIRLDVTDNDTIINGSSTPLGGVGAGNGNFTTGEVYTIDKTPPVVLSIVRASTNPTNAASVNFTVSFGESVVGLDATDFSLTTTGAVTGASVSGVTGSGPYTVSVNTGSGSGTLRLDFTSNGSVTDTLGNANVTSFTGGEVYTLDKDGPTVVSSVRANTDPTAASLVDFTVTFSESVTGVDPTDFSTTNTGSVTGTSATNVAGSGTTYTVTVNTGTGATGTVRLDVNNGASIQDAVGNTLASGFTGGQFYTIDRNAPTVVSINRANTNPTNAASVDWTVTFSQAVTGVDTSDFALANSGLTTPSISNVSGSGATWTVTANTGSGDGTLGLNLVDNDSIINGTSVPLGGAGANNGDFTGEVYNVDKTAPSVSSITRANSNPNRNASIDFTVTFSESVTGGSTSNFALVMSGVSGATISGISGSGATRTVTVNTGTGDGTLRLDMLTGSGIADPAGNGLSGVPFTTGETYTIDKTPPTVVSVTRVNTDPTAAATVDFLVTFSEAISGSSIADYSLATTGVSGASVGPINGSGATRTVTVNTGSGDGTIRLDVVTGGTIIDLAGNLFNTPFSGGETYTVDKPIAAPANLVGAVSSGKVALTWTAVTGAITYNVKRGTTPGGPYSTIASPASPSHNDTTVTNGVRYYYVVTAVDGTGESVNSNEVHAKPDVAAALGIVISQVYGAGGNAGAVFTNDFIEIFNRGNSVVDLNGWSVQYSSAAGTTWTPTALSGTIAPGRHYLIGEGAGAGGTTPLPTLDASGGIAMSGTAGKVALVAQTTALAGGCPTGLLDLAGYGSTASCFEGSGPTPNPSSNTNSLNRTANGCVDTNNNAADFANAAANPRNTAAAPTGCLLSAIGSATPASVPSGSSVLLKVELPPPTVTGIVTADLTTIGGSATQNLFDNGTNGDVTAGDNIYSFSGTATGSAGQKSLPVTANTSTPPASTNTTILLTITPPLETIAAVKVDTTPADTVPDRNGQAVLIRGVVTSIDFRGGTGIEYYIQDATAGIDIFSTSDVGPALTVGSEVEVSGTVTQFQGLTEITPTSITLLTPGTLPPVTPQTVTLSQLLDGVGEPLEGKLVRVDNLTVTAGTFPASGASGNVTVSDGTNSGTIRVDSDTDIDGTTAPGGIFSVIGLVGQSDTVAPFDSGYQILPRSTADIIPRTAATGSGAANPPSVPPGATTLLTVTITLGQNPPSTGVTVVADLSSIGLSAAQTFFDNGTNGDVSPGDQIYSYSATVSNAAALGPKSLPFQVSDAQARVSSGSISLNIQSASAPPTPVNLVATPGNAQVSLTWNVSLGATGYNVKRSTVSGGPYTTIANNIAPNNYTDSSVTNGVHYYYVVSALSGANESGNSAQADATPTAPPPAPGVKIYFVDIGQGASTLIVSPSGKSMLVDGGPGGSATTELTSTLNTALGPSGKIDYLVLTHYHVDHDAGLTDIINAGRVSPTAVAYDNGDGANVVPPVPTNSTGTAYTSYKNALSAHSITRQTAVPGTTVDLGSGVRATFMAAGGVLASGGHVWVSGTDLNSTSVSTLIEYNNFDFLISGDLTGGGQTTTAKTPDVETFVAQMTRDVDFVQLDHHGSTTANGRRFLAQLKAEASLASVGATNTFGHPNRETANKYLNIPVTNGNTYGGESLPNPGNGPVFYQTDPSPATDDRTAKQGYSGADQAHAGLGTILLRTDGLISFTMESADDGGARISPNAHVYALDGQGNGLASDFPPTVITYINPGAPTAGDMVTVTALVNDVQPITSVTLNYSLNGAAQAPVTMTPTVGSEFIGVIGPQPNGTRVDYTVTAVANSLSTTYAGGYFSGTTPISTLRSINALGEPTYLDYAARISGLVTSGTGAYSSTNNDDYIDDGTGALNLSRTIDPSSPATQPTATGNTYTVAGFINQLNGRLRLDVTPPFDGVDKPWATGPNTYNPYSVTSTGSGTVTPIARTIAQIVADGEGSEAHLVSVANCHVTSGTIPGSGGLDTFLTVTDGTASIEMKIDSDSNIFGTPTPAGTFTLVGIVQQDDYLRPFDTRYDISPRTASDFGASGSGPSLITIAEAREDIDPTTNTSPDDFVPDRLGQQVKIRGVVTSVDFRGASGTEVYIQDPTGGVDIFSTSINTTLNIGDNIEVVGTVSQFNGLTEVTPAGAPNITILSPGTLPNPVMEVVTVSQLGNSGAGESFEGKLIRVNNVTLVSPPATFAANTNYDITDGTGTVQIRIDSDTDIDGTAPPAGTFSIIGVLGQFDNASPFDSGYQLFPRIRATDFLPSVPAAAAINATAGTPQTANINTTFTTNLQATVTDGSSNPISGIGVTFTAPTTGASGSFTNNSNTITVATNASGVATAPPFTANALFGSYNVVASTGALTANFALTNVDNTATHFSVSAPSNVTSGQSFSVTVTALTAGNTTATGYTGTVHLSIAPSGDALPGDYTFIAGDNGTHMFTVTLTTTGAQTLTATDTTTSINGAANITVDPCNVPPTPSISADTNGTGTQDQACPEQPLTLHANGATGATSYQWYKDIDLLAGETNATYQATSVATYYVTATNVCGTTVKSAGYVVQNPTPHSPFIAFQGQGSSVTTLAICQGSSQTITSDSATGIQWYKDGVAIAGANSQNYVATQAGVYTAQLNALGCHSQFGRDVTLTVTPLPAQPTITGGPTTFCQGGNVTLTSSSASGNQWFLNGNPIGGATGNTYNTSVAGDYTVTVTTNGCTGPASAVTTVSVNPNPNATITAASAVQQGSTGNVASVAGAGGGATYNWSITNGTITGGTGTNSITYTAGTAGTLTLQVTVTTSAGCSDTKSANVSVTVPPPPITVTSVTPPAGKTTGGHAVTIKGSGFVTGATVTFGGAAATNVVVVNATTITAKTPAHAGGSVNVTVTNPDTSSATLTNGYKYVPVQFDANGDNVIDPSDIFYLVNYIFLHGPSPNGESGMLSGDANNDGVVDAADIFYLVNYLYLHGPSPAAMPGHATATSVRAAFTGNITLGTPVRNGDRYVIPVSLDVPAGSELPQSMALRVVFSGDAVRDAAIHQIGGTPVFEISRSTGDSLAYLVAFDKPLASGVVAQLEIAAPAGAVSIDLDPAVTLLSNGAGTRKANVESGTLHVKGTTIGSDRRNHEQKERE